MIIDSHHHLWRYDPVAYSWIGEGMERLAQDYDTEDLTAASAASGVTGSVVVQARQTIEETDTLLSIAERSEFVQGVVGWAPLAAENVAEVLDRWTDRPLLKGLRHVVQDEPDDNFLDGEEFNRGVRAVLERGYRYDILIFSRQLPAAIRFVDRHPEGRFVLDHLAKPAIAEGEFEPWNARVRDLAQRDNVCCKVSGIATEADWSTWTADTLRPYLDTVLDAFGPKRLMYGSDWPVCLLASEYERWFGVVSDWASSLSADEKEQLYWRNAAAYYGLEEMG